METPNNKTRTKTYQRAFKHIEPISISRCGDIPVEFESVCRLCLQKDDYMSEIFKDDNIVPTVVKIRSLLGLTIQEEDDLPSLICSNCAVGLNEFYIFKKRCIASDVRLRQFLLKMPPKHQATNFSQNHLNLAEDISDVNIKKNDCTISWNDQAPLAGTITEYQNATRNLPDSDSNSRLDGKKKSINHTDKNTTEPEDDDEMPLALRTLIEEENEKLRHQSLKKLRYSKVKSCQCSKMTADCRKLENHFVFKYKCSECSKIFKTISLLRRHFLVHTGERPFVCYLCDVAFSQKDTLNRHVMQIHGSIRPFKCKLCPKSYALSYLLTSHVKTSHTINSKFRCSLCPKIFNFSSGLSRHKNFHDGERYVCKVCYKMFTDKSAHKRHAKLMCGNTHT